MTWVRSGGHAAESGGGVRIDADAVCASIRPAGSSMMSPNAKHTLTARIGIALREGNGSSDSTTLYAAVDLNVNPEPPVPSVVTKRLPVDIAASEQAPRARIRSALTCGRR